MKKRNHVVKEAMKANGICQWMIAEKWGCCESSLSKLMRKELSLEDRRRVLKTIQQIIDEEKEVV